jgi:polyphosphate kinase
MPPAVQFPCVNPAGSRPARYFVGSADLMERNLDRRIEAIVPVRDVELCARLEEALELVLADDTHAWSLDAGGTWHRVPTSRGVDAQRMLGDLALERSRRRRPAETAG